MSKIKLTGENSGYVEISAGQNAGNNTLETPTSGTRLVAHEGSQDVTLNANLTVNGVLTYDDVTNIDSVGVITARAGVNVTGGSVGIGTNVPARLLHLHESNSNEALISFTTPTTGSTSGDGFRVGMNGSEEALVWNNENGVIKFGTNNTERLRITSSGVVGISTDVSGNGSGAKLVVGGRIQSNAGGYWFAGANGAEDGWHVQDSGGNLVVVESGVAERLRITSAGKLLVSGQAALNSTSLSHSIQVASASDANAIAIIGRAVDDIGELSFYEADKSTKLGELQYRQDHLNFRHRVGDIRFATGGVTERLRITADGKIGIGHQQEGQITKELTIRPANDGGIRFVRPGASGASVMSHLELTTTTSGSVFPSGEAYTVKYNTINNDQIFTTYAGGGTGGNISFQTGSGSGNEVERLRITSNGTTTVGPQYDQVKIEPGNGTYDGEATTLSVDGRTNDGNRVALKVDRYLSGTSADTKFSINYAGLVNIGGAQFSTNTTPSSGRGVEIFKSSNQEGHVQAFNRDSSSWDELRLKGSEVRLYANNNLRLDIQNAQSYLYGTSDGVLNISTTDSRGSFIRYQLNGSTKTWAGCAQGLGTGGNSDDFGIRATRDIRFRAGTQTNMRLTAAGYLQVASDSDVTGDNEHIFRQHQTTYNVLQLRAETSSYAASGGGALSVGVIRSASSSYVFGGWYSGNNSSNFQDRKFSFRGDGNGYADGSWNGSGADYAEYFEWYDGNTSSEDRRGISVVLDGDKIREATSGEDPIGVISANPSVVGDADDLQWKNKYLRTEYGSFDLDENGEQKLNPDYNSEQEYVSRENRPEWDIVGLMGKLRIRKGQVTGSRWIKMRDVSANVEEWLVR